MSSRLGPARGVVVGVVFGLACYAIVVGAFLLTPNRIKGSDLTELRERYEEAKVEALSCERERTTSVREVDSLKKKLAQSKQIQIVIDCEDLGVEE